VSFLFAAPAVLGLALLLAGPVLAHLHRRQIRERRAFGALLLLQRLQKRLQRRRLLSDRLLLALRVAALALLLLAAARPEVRWPEVSSSVGGTGRVLVLLDASLSMDQRKDGESAFNRARKDAATQLRNLPEGTRVAVITYGSSASLLTPELTEDHELAATLLEEVAPGAGGTDLRGALLLARTLLEGKPGEILVYTDESGPGVVEACAQDFERLLALGSTVLPRVVRPDVPGNVAVVSAAYGDGIEGGTVAVALANYGPDAREVPTSVFLPDGTRITSFVQVPGAGELPGAAETRFTVPRQAEGGVARVEVDDTDLPLDNTRWFHLPRVGASRVMVVDGDPGSSPTRSEVYFLERALAPWGTGGPVVDVVAPAGAGVLAEGAHRVAWLANVADPGPLGATLVDFVRRGGGLVVAMGENVSAERYNTALASLLPSPLRRPRDLVDLDGAGGPPLALPDPTVDLFRVFARAGREGFAEVHTRRLMTLEPYAESAEVATLLRTEDGVPALVERRIGNGRVLVWTGTLDLGWGNLPLQSVFAPLVQRVTALLGGDLGGNAATLEGTVGEDLLVPLPGGAAGAEVTGPDGRIVASIRTTEGVRFTPEVPGAYAIQVGAEPPFARAAVNTRLAESDVRPGTSILAAQAELAPERLTRHYALAPLALALGALALVAAGGLAMRALPESA